MSGAFNIVSNEFLAHVLFTRLTFFQPSSASKRYDSNASASDSSEEGDDSEDDSAKKKKAKKVKVVKEKKERKPRKEVTTESLNPE